MKYKQWERRKQQQTNKPTEQLAKDSGSIDLIFNAVLFFNNRYWSEIYLQFLHEDTTNRFRLNTLAVSAGARVFVNAAHPGSRLLQSGQVAAPVADSGLLPPGAPSSRCGRHYSRYSCQILGCLFFFFLSFLNVLWSSQFHLCCCCSSIIHHESGWRFFGVFFSCLGATAAPSRLAVLVSRIYEVQPRVVVSFAVFFSLSFIAWKQKHESIWNFGLFCHCI